MIINLTENSEIKLVIIEKVQIIYTILNSFPPIRKYNFFSVIIVTYLTQLIHLNTFFHFFTQQHYGPTE